MKNNKIFLIMNLVGLGFAVYLVVIAAQGRVGFEFKWLGLIIVILYSLWVRYYLRESLFKKYKFFQNGISRPYAFAAIFFLFIVMIFVLFGNDRLANGFAVIVYYFLIETVIIAVMNLKRNKAAKE